MNTGQPEEVVYAAPTQQACSEQALVLRAAGISSTIQGRLGQYVVLVADHQSAAAKTELDAYRLENPQQPRAAEDSVPRAGGLGGILVYALVVLLVAICRDRAVFVADWFAAGRTNAGLIRDGQLWRVFTALTLHIDRAHLIANLLVGGLFGLFVAQVLGSGLAWICIVIAGGAGNLVNACLRPDTHTSVGASTAVFGALGISAALAWMQRRELKHRTFSRFAPLIGGVILLGYLGAGGARTDVGGHVAGFACGALIGAILGGSRKLLDAADRFQPGLGMAAVAIIVGAWAWGLAAEPR